MGLDAVYLVGLENRGLKLPLGQPETWNDIMPFLAGTLCGRRLGNGFSRLFGLFRCRLRFWRCFLRGFFTPCFGKRFREGGGLMQCLLLFRYFLSGLLLDLFNGHGKSPKSFTDVGRRSGQRIYRWLSPAVVRLILAMPPEGR